MLTRIQYPDLFFAMRGAGSSYGIIAAFHLATEAAPASATTYKYDWQLSVDQATTQFQRFQGWTCWRHVSNAHQ
jgi:hypothetical protein